MVKYKLALLTCHFLTLCTKWHKLLRSYLNLNYSVQAPEDVHTLVHPAIKSHCLVFLVLNKPLLALKFLPGGAGEGVPGRGGPGTRTRLFDEGFGSLTKIWVFVGLHIISHLWEEGTLTLACYVKCLYI